MYSTHSSKIRMYNYIILHNETRCGAMLQLVPCVEEEVVVYLWVAGSWVGKRWSLALRPPGRSLAPLSTSSRSMSRPSGPPHIYNNSPPPHQTTICAAITSQVCSALQELVHSEEMYFA